MKRLLFLILILCIFSNLYATDTSFSLYAQLDGLLFHGFTTIKYNSSIDLLATVSELEDNVIVWGLDVTSDIQQHIGYYAFYSTLKEQSSISFKISPLSATVINDTYFVPYSLFYHRSTGNQKTTYGDGVIKAKDVATKINPGSTTEQIFRTKENSTGLRYEIVSLAVEFEGTKNISFALPQVNGTRNNYSGTIIALIEAN